MANTGQSPESNERQPVTFDPRARKVRELRRLVREGLYRPDPAEVAAAILREWATDADDQPRPDSATFAERFVVTPGAPEPSRDVALPA